MMEIKEFDEFVKAMDPKLNYILFKAEPAFGKITPVDVYKSLDEAKDKLLNFKKNNIGTMDHYYLIPAYNFFI